jgi:hypothetical protein
VLKLSYLVNSVGWSPAYSARLNDKHDRLALEYQAVLTQMSGEHWPNVQLTLSTSYPRMLAAAPVLSPLRVSLVSAGEGQQAEVANADAYNEKRAALQQQLRSAKGEPRDLGDRVAAGPRGERGPVGPQGPKGEVGPAIPAQSGYAPAQDEAFAANLLAAQLQNVELTAPDDVVRLSRTSVVATSEGVAVEYPIPGRITIESRKDQQMFHIATLDLAATSYYSAVPLLTDYVYQSAECVNTSDYPLLPGPYNAYVGSAFAGRGDLPLVARGQGLTIGFGTESQLRASRELEDKTTTVRGGNNVVQYTYRLRLSNYMDKPVKVRLWDRLPQAPDDQVSITLTKPEPALSEDPVYLAQQKARGLLRWDVEVPANASGAKVHTFNYQFKVEFDKNYTIGEIQAGAKEAMRKDLEVMQRIQMAAPAAAAQ